MAKPSREAEKRKRLLQDQGQSIRGAERQVGREQADEDFRIKESTPGTPQFEEKIRSELKAKQERERIETQFAAEQINPDVKAAQEENIRRQEETAEQFPINVSEKTRTESQAEAGFATLLPAVNKVRGNVGLGAVTPQQLSEAAPDQIQNAAAVIGFISTAGVNIGGANLRIAELLTSKSKQIGVLNSDVNDIASVALRQSQNLGSQDTDVIIDNLETLRDSTQDHLIRIQDLMLENPESLSKNADISAEAQRRLSFIDQKILDARIFKATGRLPTASNPAVDTQGGLENEGQ